MSIEKALKSLENEWADAEVRKSAGFFVPEDGSYVVNLINASVQISQTNRIQVVWTLKMTSGKDKGKTWNKFDGIEDPIGMSFVKGTMDVLGIEIPKKMVLLPGAFKNYFEENPDGVLVNVTVRTRNDFQNTYINGLAESEQDLSRKEKREEDKVEDEKEEEGLEDMTYKELKKYIANNKLPINVGDYDTAEELINAIKKAKKKSTRKSRFIDEE